MLYVFDDILIWIGALKLCLRPNSLAAVSFCLFFLQRCLFCEKRLFLTTTCISTDIYGLCIFLKQANRRGTKNHSIWRCNFVMSSRGDPSGDQNGVQS